MAIISAANLNALLDSLGRSWLLMLGSSSSGAAYNSASPASDEYDVEAIVRRTTSDSNPLGGIIDHDRA
jgi:hypothetical protein